MSTHDFLDVISVFADIALIIFAASKLHRMPQDYDNRPVVMGIIAGIAMLMMHVTGLTDKSQFSHDIRAMCWQFLSLVSEVTIIKLIVSIPSKK